MKIIYKIIEEINLLTFINSKILHIAVKRLQKKNAFVRK